MSHSTWCHRKACLGECWGREQTGSEHIEELEDRIQKLETERDKLRYVLDSINERVMPGTADSVDCLREIIRERDSARGLLKDLCAECAVMREALEWYAVAEETITPSGWPKAGPPPWTMSHWDEGERARKSLSLSAGREKREEFLAEHDENVKPHFDNENFKEDLIERAAEIDALRAKLAILEDPSDARCMDIAAMRDRLAAYAVNYPEIPNSPEGDK